jgi:two-component system, NtrC family, sensor histidine kinase KinB
MSTVVCIGLTPLFSANEQLFNVARKGLGSSAGVIALESGAIILFASAMVLLGALIATLVYFLFFKNPAQPAASPPLSEENNQRDENQERANIINRAILNAIPSPVFVLRDDGEFIQVNPAAEKLSESLRLAGRLPSKIQHILEECRKDQSHYMPQDPQDALVFRINDEEVYFLPRIFRVDSGTDSVAGWAVLLHNVSRIRWLDDMKTNYIATVSHDIKTPLTCIRMVLLLLLEERSAQLDPTQRILITSASEDCERLLATVNRLLALSLAESGALHLNLVPLSLQSTIGDMFHKFEKAAQDAGIKLRLEGNTESFPKVLADPVRLAEVMENLMSNAINHSPKGGEIIIRITKLEAEYIRLSVIDQGEGVPIASQHRIFDRFYRAPGQGPQGLGLGLFISRDIMTAHEGRIGLLDRTENLTEFFIDVPIA